jgi:hypothetical protein
MNGSPKLNSSNKNSNQNSNHSNAETRHVEPFKLSDYQRFLARSVENVRQSSSTNQVANEVNYNPPPGLGSDPLDVVFKPMNDRIEKNDRSTSYLSLGSNITGSPVRLTKPRMTFDLPTLTL